MKKLLFVLLVLFAGSISAQPLNNWLEFDGFNDYVSFGNSSTLKPRTALTIEMWGYNPDWSTINDMRLISNTQGGGYNIQVEAGLFQGLVYANGDYRRVTLDRMTLSEGWHHFALTYDGQYTKLYVDGELIDTDDAGAVYSISYDSDNCTLLGTEATGNCDPDGNYFEGTLDEVRIWSVARTQQQIQDNMEIEVNSASTGLVGYWKLNETSGTTAEDATSNSNDGTLHNMSNDAWTAAFETVSNSLLGVFNSSAAWGDYDNDGDLDILLTGDTYDNGDDYYDRTGFFSKVYKNNGDGIFTEQTEISLKGVSESSAAWVDYDNDGDLDIQLTGYSSSSFITKIYKNNGNGNFIDSEISLLGFGHSSTAWGDYDNDGDLDVLLTGLYTGNLSRIYKNNGDGTFSNSGISLTGVGAGSVAWGDYDNDGDLDILLTGQEDGGALVSEIYNNNGGTFIESGISLPGVYHSSAAWGDYDNDGDLDILITGETYAGPISKIYNNNNGNGTFDYSGISLTGAKNSSVAWGDYNNDGYLDILLVGEDTWGYPISEIYKNNGDGTFSNSGIPLSGGAPNSVAWGDYDNDGDLDILMVGENNFFVTAVSKIYKNNCVTSNSSPNKPSILSSFLEINGSEVSLNWNAVTDNETSSQGLTYNLRVGTTPGGSEIMSPMADVTDGLRKIPALGNVNQNTTWTLENIQQWQRYYWSVQAVDNCFAGSEFATEQSFMISTNFSETSIILPGISHVSAAWGDYDNDGDLDILLTGEGDSGPISEIYKNEGDGTFSNSGISLTGVKYSSAAWGDYDNDSDLDILLTGNDGSCPISKIYKNNGDGTFLDSGISLTGVEYSSAAWGDYDNDGDLDILLTGDNGSGPISQIYKNNGDGTFSESGISLTDVDNSSVAWGDYDNDGDLDILLTGLLEDFSSVSKIYKNNGDGTFSDSGISLTGVCHSSVAWGDYDNDGDLDILLTGYSSSGRISKIYKNNGDGTFSESGISLTVVAYCSVAWGDYDNDGDLDILLTGDSGSDYISKIYKNNGDGTFSNSEIPLTGVCISSAAWGDYDNDGDLDILISGNSSSGIVSKIYKNRWATSNSTPASPSDLSSFVNGSEATLSWNSATDNETPSEGLTYNLRVGTTSGGNDIMSPVADASNGLRKIAALGNTNQNTSWTIGDLQQGERYYWSVQAIDNCFAGSEFASEGSFVFNENTPDTEAGNMLSFDGIDDKVSGSGLLTGNSAYTIEAWVYNNSLPSTAQRYITVSPEVAVLRHDGNSQVGQLHFYIKDSDGSFWSVRANGVLETGKWYHVAGVSDGSEMKLYLNGEEVGSSSPAGTLYSNNGEFYFSSSSEAMDGYIDEVRIWNVARTETQIRENMHKTLSDGETGLIGYWQMNSDAGSSTALDFVENNNGTLLNMDVNSVWINSSVPVGGGTSCSCGSFTSGTEIMGNVSITTTDDFDNEVGLVLTEIENSPNTTSGLTGNPFDRYFVLCAFGTPGTFITNLTFTLPEGYISAEDQATPSNLKLYRRESNSDEEWTLIASATSATSTKVTFEGVTSFSQFIIASESSPLPVELVSFEANVNEEQVELKWQTVTEVNNYGFEVQKSDLPAVAGVSSQNSEETWQKIAFVEGAGNSNSPKEYSFVDNSKLDGKYQYRLKQIDIDGNYKYSDMVEVEINSVPSKFSLSQNYPNPFNPSTVIRYSLPVRQAAVPAVDALSSLPTGRQAVEVHISLKIYDILGNEVTTLVNQNQPAGNYEVTFNAKNLASGMYFYRLQTSSGFIATKKLMLMK